MKALLIWIMSIDYAVLQEMQSVNLHASAFPSIGIPSGLEYLSQVDQLLVKQKVELFEALTGFETANKYTIKNSMGQKVYYAAEGIASSLMYRSSEIFRWA